MARKRVQAPIRATVRVRARGSGDDAGHAPDPLVFQTFGATRAVLGADRIVPGTGTLFALLVRVAYSPGYRCSRDLLVTLLWPGQSQRRQLGNLRQTLYKARAIGIQVALVGDSVCLDPQQVVTTFTLSPTSALFERDVVRGHEPFGVFLPGYTVAWPEYQEWVDEQRATVHASVRRVLVEHLRIRRERADWTGAEALARWLLQFDPLNEDATLTLAECTMLAGAKAEAVAIIDRYLEELGPTAGDIRLPATQLRKRFTEPPSRKRAPFVDTERHFVGRTTELADLTMAMRRARWHDGSAVILEGPSGIGKSRLINELSKIAQIEGFLELRAECRDGDLNRPLRSLLEPITELLSLPGALGCSPHSMDLLRRLVGIDIAEANASASTRPLPLAADSVADLSSFSSLRTQSIRHSIIDLIGAVTEEKPLFLVIEDAHWIDNDTWDVVVDLAERVGLMRVFLVITTRPPAQRVERPLWPPSPLPVVTLHALLPEESRSLARWLSHEMAAPLSQNAEDWIVSASEGSPLLLQALVAHWSETGEASGIPPTLQALLDHRIERLPLAAVRALQTISLLGIYASLERVTASLELPTHELLSALDHLEKEGYLARGEAALIVCHELIGQAATNRLSALGCATLRASIAELFEREFAFSGDIAALLQAIHHHENNRSHDSVLRLMLKYSEQLTECVNPSALLQTLTRLEQTDNITSLPVTLRRLQARLAVSAGEYTRALGVSPSGIQLPLVEPGLSEEDATFALSVVDSAFRADPFVDRSELSSFATRIVRSDWLSRPIRLRAAEIAIVIATNDGDGATARTCYDAFLPIEIERIDDPHVERIAMLFHTVFGSLETAAACARSLFTRSLGAEPSPVSFQDAARAGYALRLCGHASEAERAFTRSYRIAIDIDAPHHAQFAAWQLANMALEVGDMDIAIDWTTALGDLYNDEEDEIASNFVVAFFCRIAIAQGDREAAQLYFERYQRTLPRFPSIKATTYLVALELGCRLLNSEWVPSDALLAVASSRFEMTARLGTSDFFASVHCRALIRAGKPVDAELSLRDYLLRYRRERSLPAVDLLRLAESLKVEVVTRPPQAS